MQSEKRKGLVPIPRSLEEWLNLDQKAMLSTIESYGWELKFIRRTGQEESTVIVVNPQGNQVGVLERDGQLNLESGVTLR